MPDPEIRVRLPSGRNEFRAGEILRGEVEIRSRRARPGVTVNVSLGWCTRGRGNQNRSAPVRLELWAGDLEAESVFTRAFEIRLPAGPVSYRGSLLELAWFLQAEARLGRMRSIKVSRGLSLGPGAEPEKGAAASGMPAYPALTLDRPFMTLMGVILVFTGLAFLVPVVHPSAPRPGAGSWVAFVGYLALVAGFLVAGAVTLLRSRWSAISELRLGAPRLRFPRRGFRGDESIPLEVALEPRMDVAVRGIFAELRCCEIVQRGWGDQADTEQAELFVEEWCLRGGSGPVGPGRTIRAKEMLKVPLTAAPSFRARDVEVRWTLKVRVDVLRWPDWVRQYLVTVLPSPGQKGRRSRL